MSKCYLVVDCGTTNLRVTLLNENKEKLDVVKAEGGVRHTAIDGHNDRLRTMLKESMETVLSRNGYKMEDVEKCVASGMITSALGLLDLIMDTIESRNAPSGGVSGTIKEFFKSLLGG